MFFRPISGFDIFIFICREGMSMRADRNTFLYDPDHRLLFCRNAKVSDALSEQILLYVSNFKPIRKLERDIWQDVFRCPQLSTYILKYINWCSELFSDLHWYSLTFSQMFKNVHICSKMVSDHWSQMFTDDHSCSQLFKDIHRCSQMFKEVHRWS